MSAQPAVKTRRPGPERVLGRYDTGRPGPVVVVVTGMHGNEPSGVAAALAVLGALERDALPLRGTLIALAGNLAALRAGRRFVVRDLNRMWTDEQVRMLRRGGAGNDDVEEGEQRALLAEFDRIVDAHPDREVVFLDLHSTSAEGAPFHCISDTLHSRRIALATPIPLILGIEEMIRGTLLDFLEERGRPLILVEGGQHDDPATPARHEAAIWQALVTVGCLDESEVPDLGTHRMRLREGARGLPPVIEVVYHHGIGNGDRFRMREGYRNFQPVRKGEVIADDERGEVTVPIDGLLLMPLYQTQGDDGFLVGRAVRRPWLGVSTVLRTLRLDRLLPYLPGVRRDRTRPDRLLVDRRVARWFTVQLFHLCGYRRLPDRDGRQVFTRRIEA